MATLMTIASVHKGADRELRQIPRLSALTVTLTVTE